MSNQKTLAELEKRAKEIRAEVPAGKQAQVFAAAIEAGYLAAAADGEMDDIERASLVRAIEVLSLDSVIEWETETLVNDCKARAEKDGAEARAKAVGASLKELGQAESGLLVAAIVACATGGVAKVEAEALKHVGKAAGLSADKVKGIVKRATTILGAE